MRWKVERTQTGSSSSSSKNSTSTLALISQRARELDCEDLARQARKYYLLHQTAIDGERGGIPRGIVAVLGFLHERPNCPFPLSAEEQKRLQIYPGMAERLVFWGACRQLNELAQATWLEGFELEPREFWTLVIQAHGLDLQTALRARRLRKELDLETFFESADTRALAQAFPGYSLPQLAYRLLSAAPKVRAGELVAEALGEELVIDYELRSAPDDRIARILHRTLGAAYTLGGAALTYATWRKSTG